MRTLWPAATLAIVITGYFVWTSHSTFFGGQSLSGLDDCHRLAGEVAALHSQGGIISDDMLSAARACSVSYGQDWAMAGGEHAALLRAEGAMRIR